MNLTSLNTYGISVGGQYLPELRKHQVIKHVGFNYTYLLSEKHTGQDMSLYVLDYLTHNFAFNLSNRLPLKNLDMSITYNFRQRSGSYLDYDSGQWEGYDPVHQLNVKVAYVYKWMKYYFSARNLLDSKVSDYPYIPQPGRWIMLGVTGRIGL